ncbi:MAG: Alpha/Beta hydrolase protein [Monoraphidium minutum]|nr:MAG: Alpha/Beta hydrolase protein [Monoraphidium minutum]
MPEVSIVDYLASKGWDVWCVCLRGNGASDKESKIDLSSWTIDDHLFQDVPAVLQFVLNKTGTEQVHWIGHSMGGMLGCGLLSQGDSSRYSETLKSLTMYGSGCFGDGSWHSLLKRIVVPVTRMGFPADLACQGMSLLTDKPAALSVFETLFYWFPNVEKHVRKRLLQSCFNYIPTTLTGQFLDSHDSPNGLMNVRHTFKYADPEVLGETAVPVLAVNGDWDLFCPAAGGKKTADLFGGPKKAITIGKAHGHCSHYGHFDVIVGRSAKDEVWPQVLKFLEDNDD